MLDYLVLFGLGVGVEGGGAAGGGGAIPPGIPGR